VRRFQFNNQLFALNRTTDASLLICVEVYSVDLIEVGVFSPNLIALLANYVTVVEYRLS